MASHVAVVTPGARQPLATLQRPTRAPETGEIRVRVMWTASTPLDLHQADGGLLVTPPQVLGDGLAGVVVQLGENVQNLAIGDKVGDCDHHRQQRKQLTSA
jgi:NADPH:quinone reductase-like Zn-dependent oxidoreductase